MVKLFNVLSGMFTVGGMVALMAVACAGSQANAAAVPIFCSFDKTTSICNDGFCFFYDCHGLPSGDPKNPSCCY
jgi:hypothetical protein